MNSIKLKGFFFAEQCQDTDKVFQDHPELFKLFRKFKNIEEIQTYHILVLLLRLQQMCCHPILIKGVCGFNKLKFKNIFTKHLVCSYCF